MSFPILSAYTTQAMIGKQYCELHIDALDGSWPQLGFSSSETGLNYSVSSAGFWTPSGPDNLTINVGDIIMLASDGEGNCWFGQNGAWIGGGDPVTGANPTYTGLGANPYPSVSISEAVGAAGQATGRFQDSAFTYAVPAGFTSIQGD